FWSIGRPLAIAAVLAVFGIIAGVAFWPRQQPSQFAGPVNLPPAELSDVQAEVTPELHEELTLAVPAETAPAQAGSAPVDTYRRDDLTAQPATGSAPVLAKRGKPAKAVPASRISGGLQGFARSATLAPAEEFDRSDRYSDIRAPKGEFNTAAYDHILENPFLDAKSNPLSTFSIDVDTASYSNIRRFINEGSLPPKDAVRVEEMINYFTYDYVQPTDGRPFAV